MPPRTSPGLSAAPVKPQRGARSDAQFHDGGGEPAAVELDQVELGYSRDGLSFSVVVVAPRTLQS